MQQKSVKFRGSLGHTLKTYKLESLKNSKFTNSYYLPQLNQEYLYIYIYIKAQAHLKQLPNFTKFLTEN